MRSSERRARIRPRQNAHVASVMSAGVIASAASTPLDAELTDQASAYDQNHGAQDVSKVR